MSLCVIYIVSLDFGSLAPSFLLVNKVRRRDLSRGNRVATFQSKAVPMPMLRPNECLEEVPRGFLVAGCDNRRVLDVIEESLNEITLDQDCI